LPNHHRPAPAAGAGQVLPWARGGLQWQSVGTPLTHQRFRRRSLGAYCARARTRGSGGGGGGDGGGNGVQQGAPGGDGAPRAVVAMPGLYCVGDNVFPYVGTPAAAANGMWVANTLAPVWRHWAAANAAEARV
jgi:hypothetical protein